MKYTKAVLQDAVDNSLSMSGVLRFLSLHQSGGNHSHIKRRIEQFNIDTSHFLGQFQGLGGAKNKLHYSDVLILRSEKSRRQKAYILRRAMIESGIAYICNICGQSPTWNGGALTLEVDHINGIPWDDRPENVQFACPNCHAQLTKNR